MTYIVTIILTAGMLVAVVAATADTVTLPACQQQKTITINPTGLGL